MGKRLRIKQKSSLLFFSLTLPCFSLSLFLLYTYLLDRRDGQPQRLGLLGGAAALVRGEDEAGGASRSGGEAVGEGLFVVFDVDLSIGVSCCFVPLSTKGRNGQERKMHGEGRTRRRGT